MATNQQMIEQQRQQLQQAQQRAQALAKRDQISKAQLFQKQTGLAARAQRKAQAERQKQFSRQALAQVEAQSREFETQVARIEPGLAKPEFLEKSYQEAKAQTTSQLSSIQSQIAKEQKILSQARERGSATERIEDRIVKLQAIAGSYRGALAGSRESLVRGYFSGQTSRLASFEGEKVYASTERGRAKEAFATQQGFESYAKFEKALAAQQLPSVVSQVKEEGGGLFVRDVGQKPPTTVQPVSYYDPSMVDYAAPSGAPVSVIPDFAPQVTPVTVKPPQTIVQQYKDMGFTQKQAERVAIESVKQKIDFTLEGAKQIARRTIPEKVFGEAKDIGRFYYGAAAAGVKRVPPIIITTTEFAKPAIDVAFEREVQVLPTVVEEVSGYRGRVTYEEVAKVPKEAIVSL